MEQWGAFANSGPPSQVTSLRPSLQFVTLRSREHLLFLAPQYLHLRPTVIHPFLGPSFWALVPRLSASCTVECVWHHGWPLPLPAPKERCLLCPRPLRLAWVEGWW